MPFNIGALLILVVIELVYDSLLWIRKKELSYMSFGVAGCILGSYIISVILMISIDDEHYWDYVDMDSFAKIYLLDKLFMENDAMWDGMYFYKDKESPLLKAGPVWDYDRSCGTILTDYTNDIAEAPDSMDGWYEHFYADKNFKDAMVASYVKIQPDMERML